jgi:hypothetical protein
MKHPYTDKIKHCKIEMLQNLSAQKQLLLTKAFEGQEQKADYRYCVFNFKLRETSSDLCKLQHGELPRISQIERPNMLTLHQAH